MNELVLQVNSGILPQGVCPTDYQALANLLAANFTVTFPSSFTGIITSSAQPTDTTKAWAQLDSSGRFVRLYTFAQGHWLSPHPLVSGFIMIWPFALPNFATFDGGDANVPGPQSGPMWQQAQDSQGNLIMAPGFPLGAGKLPNSGNTVNVGDTGGEDQHILSIQEMPPHVHLVENVVAKDTASFAGGGFNGSIIKNVNTDSTGGDPNSGNPPVAALPHNNLPPYYGVYFLQRTSRLFFSV